MQNQFQTDPEAEPIPMPLDAMQAERTNTQMQEVQTAQAARELLAKMQRKVRRGKIREWGSIAAIFGIGFLPLILKMLVPTNLLPTFLMNHFVPYALAMLVGFLFLTLNSSLRKTVWNAEELAQIGEVEAVGTLLESMERLVARSQFAPLMAVLTRLLPQMKASDAGLLTARQSKILYRSLTWDYKTFDPSVAHRYYQFIVAQQDYVLTILKALEQVGDADAIPIVKQIANRKAVTTFQKELKAAAEQCLPLLQIHLSKVDSDQTLLRASSPESSSPELLLRPAEFTPDADTKQLLKAANIPAPLPPAS